MPQACAPFPSSASALRLSASPIQLHVDDMRLPKSLMCSPWLSEDIELKPARLHLGREVQPEVPGVIPQSRFPRPSSVRVSLILWVYQKEENLQLGRAALGEDPCCPQWICDFSSQLLVVCTSLGLSESETIWQTGNLKGGIQRCTKALEGTGPALKFALLSVFPCRPHFFSEQYVLQLKRHKPPQSTKRKLLAVSCNQRLKLGEDGRSFQRKCELPLIRPNSPWLPEGSH